MPIMFWSRDTDPAATPSVLPKPPSEARGVDNIMKLRKVMPGSGDAEVTPSIATSPRERAGAGPDAPMSIQDRLEGQRPKDIKAWLDFRVSWVRDSVLLAGIWAPEDLCVQSPLMTKNLAD